MLRELLSDDLDGMFELDSDPEVHRYLGNKPVVEKEQLVEVINKVRMQYQQYGIGRWAIVDKNTNDFIGWAGLKFVTEKINGHQNFYDLGYRLIRRYWGLGIATETANAALAYAFNTLALDELYAAASCENVASNKVLHRIGMKCVETFYYEEIKCNWYRIDKTDFSSNR